MNFFSAQQILRWIELKEDSEKPFKTTKFADTLFKEYLRKVIYWEVIRSPQKADQGVIKLDPYFFERINYSISNKAIE